MLFLGRASLVTPSGVGQPTLPPTAAEVMNPARFEGALPDAESPPPRVASLGRLPFSLSADELRQRGAEILVEERRQLADLASRSGSASIASFLEPLNRILVAAADVGAHGGLLFQAHPSPEIREAGRELSEDSDRFFNEFRLNEAVYRHLRSIDLSDQDPTTRWGLERLLKEMRRAGVEQPVPRRKEIVGLANELDQVENEFSANISSAVRSVVTEGTEPLRGLPVDFIAAHAPSADGKIRITTKYPDVFPVLSYADDSDLRRRLYYEFMNVAAPENLRVLHDLLVGRRKFVRLLGYSDFAQYAVENKMSERPEVVETFLDRVRNLVREPSRQEMARLLARKRKDHPEATRLEDWDGPLVAAGYYGTKIREEEYGSTRDGFERTCRTPRCATGSSTCAESCSVSSFGVTALPSYGTRPSKRTMLGGRATPWAGPTSTSCPDPENSLTRPTSPCAPA